MAFSGFGSSRWQKDTPGPIDLHHEDPATFTIFAHWLYTGNIRITPDVMKDAEGQNIAKICQAAAAYCLMTRSPRSSEENEESDGDCPSPLEDAPKCVMSTIVGGRISDGTPCNCEYVSPH